MTTQGDDILMDMVKRDIERLEKEDHASLCAHCGMLTLLKCKEAELRGSPAVGKGAITLIASGVSGFVYALIEVAKVLSAK
jgi:hypothetical protein